MRGGYSGPVPGREPADTTGGFGELRAVGRTVDDRYDDVNRITEELFNQP